MKYNGTIYRPPVEANTFLLPITEGCTHNSCTFCNMYQGIPFRMLPLTDVEEYLAEVKQAYGKYCDRIERVYLVGADPFALSAKNLLERIELIKKYLPNAATITMYARTDNIAHKSDEDLKEAGVNDLVMTGAVGKGRGLESARALATLENDIKPAKILVTTMTAFVGTKLDEDIRTGAFVRSTEKENLEEERELLAGLELPDCYFWAVHNLDSVKVEGILRENKQRMLDALSWAIDHVKEGAINRTSRVGTL